MAQEHRILFADNPWVVQLKRNPVIEPVPYRQEGATIAEQSLIQALQNTAWEVQKSVPKPVINKPVVIERDREDFLRDPAGYYEECKERSMLGSGHYGAAAATLDGNVIKKFAIKDGYGCWIAFCAYAYRRGHGCANIPRVYAIALPDCKDTSEYGYALMERLEVDHDKHPWEVADAMYSIHCRIQEGQPVSSKTLQPLQRLWAEYSAMMCKSGVGLSADLHSGNILHRGNTYVVTDPSCRSGFTAYEKYLDAQHTLCTLAAVFDARFYAQMRKQTVIKTTIM
jgi:hypothetical protein